MRDVIASDEFRHEPTGAANWQENYVFHCWDAERNSGWYLHLGYVESESLLDVRVCVFVNGVATSAIVQGPGTDCLAAPGLDTRVVTPLERIKLRYQGIGGRGPSSDGFYGGVRGDVPFGFDIEMISEHPPVEWTGYLKSVDMDYRVLGDGHYEQGARWQGRLWSGDQEVMCDGLLVRDHSWGPRLWSADSDLSCFWLPIVLDGGKTFITSFVGQEYNIRKTFSTFSDQSGVINVCYDNWVHVVGHNVPRQFNKACLLRLGDDYRERYDYTGHAVIPFLRHSSWEDKPNVTRCLADMYSTVQGEGRTGFGTLQQVTTAARVKEGFANPKADWRGA